MHSWRRNCNIPPDLQMLKKHGNVPRFFISHSTITGFFEGALIAFVQAVSEPENVADSSLQRLTVPLSRRTA